MCLCAYGDQSEYCLSVLFSSSSFLRHGVSLIARLTKDLELATSELQEAACLGLCPHPIAMDIDAHDHAQITAADPHSSSCTCRVGTLPTQSCVQSLAMIP